MKIGHEVFLAVARELSMSKAAKQLFITQQCASDHIKRLEAEYGVILFERKPKLRLTAAGEIMFQSLRNIKIMETKMDENLGDMSRGILGSMKMGISTSRAPIILPKVLPLYYQDYPRVTISFNEADTQILEQNLLSGELDMFIGVNTTPFEGMEIETIANDEIMLVISSELLAKHFSLNEIEKMKYGIDLNRFSRIPFILPDFTTGKVNHVIQEYLNTHNVKLTNVYYISDTKTQIYMCATGLCAALCPKMLLGALVQHNQLCSENERKLQVFPVRDLGGQLRIDLVTHSNVFYQPYATCLMDILREVVPSINPVKDGLYN